MAEQVKAVPPVAIGQRSGRPISVSALARKIGGIPPSRLNVWLRGADKDKAHDGSAPMANLAYRVGEAFNEMGVPESCGAIAALAAGALPDFIDFLAMFGEYNSHEAIEMMAIAPALIGAFKIDSNRVAAYNMREGLIDKGLNNLRPRLDRAAISPAYGSRSTCIRALRITDWFRSEAAVMRNAWDNRSTRRVNSVSGVLARAARDLAISLTSEPLDKAWPIVWSVLEQWGAAVDTDCLIEYEEIIKGYSSDPYLNRFRIDDVVKKYKRPTLN